MMHTCKMLVLVALLGAAQVNAAIIVSYGLSSPGAGAVQSAFSGKVNAENYDPRSDVIEQDGSGNTISGFSNQNDNVYLRASGSLQSSLPGFGTNAYHTFGLSVTGLGAQEVLDLTAVNLTYDVTGTTTGTAFFFSFFSDAVGFDDLNDRLGNGTWGGSQNDVTINLTSSNAVAGSAFTGLTNGTDIEFRIYFGDDGVNEDNTAAIHRVRQYLTIEGEPRVVPEPATGALVLLSLGAVLLRRFR